MLTFFSCIMDNNAMYAAQHAMGVPFGKVPSWQGGLDANCR